MTRKGFKFIIILFVCVILINLMTFLTLSKPKLRRELFPDYISELCKTNDSIYVCDFHLGFPDLNKYYSHDLLSYRNEIKTKTGCRYIYFEQNDSTLDTLAVDKKFRIQYYTYYFRSNGFIDIISKPFTMTQYECFVLDKFSIERTVKFKWRLFFWRKFYEENRTWDFRLKNRGRMIVE